MAKASKRKPSKRVKRTIAVQLNVEEDLILEQAIDEAYEQGYSVSISQLVRWAIREADFSKIPLMP